MDEDLGARQGHRAEPLFDPYHKWLGIPPQEQPPNHYRLLGISLCETDSEVIDAAAQRQMAYLQACTTGTRALLAQRLVDDIAAARLCLLDRARKATYDAALKRRRDTAPQATQGSLTGEWLVEPQSVDVPSLEPPISTKPAGFGYGLRFALIGAIVTAAAVGVLSLLVLSRLRQNNAVSSAPDVTDRTRIVEPPTAPPKASPIGPPSEPVVTQAEPPAAREEVRPEPPPDEAVQADRKSVV